MTDPFQPLVFDSLPTEEGPLCTPARLAALTRVLDRHRSTPDGRDDEIDALQAALEALQGINEADRIAGQAMRQARSLSAGKSAMDAWLDLAKKQAGYPATASFNQVWNETLARAGRDPVHLDVELGSLPAVGAAPVDPREPTTF